MTTIADFDTKSIAERENAEKKRFEDGTDARQEAYQMQQDMKISNLLSTRQLNILPTDEMMRTFEDAGVDLADYQTHSDFITTKAVLAMYLLTEENMSVEDIRNLKDLPDQQRYAIGERFVKALEDHPVRRTAVESGEEIEKNAEWFGRMMAGAVKKIKESGLTYPSADDIADPQKAAQIMNGGFGLLWMIGEDFENLTHVWCSNAGAEAFERGYGGMQALREDLNTISAGAAVAMAAAKAPFFEKGVYANYAEGLEEPDKNYFYIFNSEVHGFTADGDHDGIGVPFEVEQTDGKAAFHIGGAEEDPDVFIVTSAGDGMIHGYFEDTPDRPLVFEYLAEANPDTFMIEHFPDAPEEGE